jgi:predicted nucleic acid-binding Zn finger protein
VELKNKSDVIVSERRTKLHVFEPSQRKIWTVVGMEKEYWLAPDFDFCSCQGYYFGKSKGKPCYHLESVMSAKNENNFEIIMFSDNEYCGFMSSLISDL